MQEMMLLNMVSLICDLYTLIKRLHSMFLICVTCIINWYLYILLAIARVKALFICWFNLQGPGGRPGFGRGGGGGGFGAGPTSSNLP